MNDPTSPASGDGPSNALTQCNGELAKLVNQILSKLDSGQHVDWSGLKQEYPQFVDDLDEIRPAMDALHQWQVTESNASQPNLQAREPVRHRTLGDFEIIQEIGRGGMGVVYEAQQISIRRRVALKILPLAELIDDRMLTRFRNEVTAIASLDHPNIVSVYSIGEQRGIHYYAMQLIRGQSLSSVIHDLRIRNRDESVTGSSLIQQNSAVDDPNRRPPEKSAQLSFHVEPDQTAAHETHAQGGTGTHRIIDPTYFQNITRLIIPVADALQHAHEQGIIHRDIKPGNLLLDWNGKLFITDFGLARIEVAAGVTLTGDMIGTLRYMSPEQVQSGNAIDHRTDVYSLGATLYELATLEPIWSGNDRPDLIRRISVQEPIRPRRLTPSIPADLETIILKATEKNVVDRYLSAAELSNDLRRFLEHKPISAQRPSVAQRVGKWAKRNPAILLTSLAISLIFSVGLGFATLEINHQRTKALAQKTEARQQTEFARQVVMDMYTNFATEWLNEDVELDAIQQSYLEKAILFFEELTAEDPEDRRNLVGLAESVNALGRMQGKLRRNEQAIESLQRAVDLYDESLEFDRSDESVIGLASSTADLCTVLTQNGIYDESARIASAFLNGTWANDQQFGNEPSQTRFRIQLSRIYLQRALTVQPSGEPESLPDLEQAVAISRQLVSRVGNDIEFQSQFTRSLGFLAKHHYLQRNLDTAVEISNEAVLLAEDAIRAHPRNRNLKANLRRQFRFQGLVYGFDGLNDFSLAMKVSERFRAIAHEMVDTYGTYADRYNLAVGYYQLGNLTNSNQDWDQANDAYRKAIEVCEALEIDFPDDLKREHQQVLAKSCLNFASCLSKSNSPESQSAEIDSLVDRAAEILRDRIKKDRGPDDLGTLTIAIRMQTDRLEQGDPRAKKLAQEVVDIRRELVQSHPSNLPYQTKLAGGLHNLANQLNAAGTHRDAMETLEEAIRIQTRVLEQLPDQPTANKFLKLHYTILINMHLFCPTQELRDSQRIVVLARDALTRWETSWLWAGLKNKTSKPFQFNDYLANGLLRYRSILQVKDPLRIELGQEAVLAQRQLAKQFPDDLDYRARLGFMIESLALDYRSSGDYENAISRLEEAIAIQLDVLKSRLNHRDALVYLEHHKQMLVFSYLFARDPEARNAVRAKEILKIQPDSAVAKRDKNSPIGLAPWAQECMAIVFYQTGKYERAVDLMEGFVEAHPDSAGACFVMAASHAKLNRLEIANQQFEIGTKLIQTSESEIGSHPYLEEYRGIAANLLKRDVKETAQ